MNQTAFDFDVPARETVQPDFAYRESTPEKFRLAAPTCHATGCNRSAVAGQQMCAVHLAMFARQPGQDPAAVILTPDDIQTLTGYKRHAEQKKELDHLKIAYKVRRDGSLVVVWGDVQVRSPAPEPEPEMWS